jgi:hypothetical protein
MMWQDDAADAPLMFEGFDGQRRAVPVPGRLMAHLGQNANRCEVVLLSQPQPDQRLRITRAVLPSL